MSLQDMSLQDHIYNTLRLTPSRSPWSRLILCGVATTLPLLLGYFQSQLGVAMFGSLVSFLLMINDNFGTLRRRIYNFTMTLVLLVAGLEIGIQLRAHPLWFAVTLVGLTYMIGLMEAKNSPFEKALVLAAFQMLAGFAIPGIETYLGSISLYAAFGYGIIIVGTTLTVLLYGHQPQKFEKYRETLRLTLTKERNRHFYALTYSLTILATVLLVNYFRVDHGYWAVGTVLITMRPDSLLSIYRSIQRFLGTFVGVLFAGFLIYYIRDPLLLIGMVFVTSLGVLWALATSYWLGSAFLSVILLILLDLPLAPLGNLTTPFLRLQATAIGCGCTILSILFIQLHKKWTKLLFE